MIFIQAVNISELMIVNAKRVYLALHRVACGSVFGLFRCGFFRNGIKFDLPSDTIKYVRLIRQ